MITATFTFGVSQNYNANLINSDLKENADLVVRKSSTSHDISSPTKIISTYHYVHTILTQKAHGAGNVDIYYAKDISKVKNLNITYYDSSGNVIKKVKKKEIGDRASYSSGNMADDSRFLYYHTSHNRFPYSVEVSYTTESQYAATIDDFSAYPYGGFFNSSVANSDFTIIGSKSDVIYKEKNLEAYKEYITYDESPMKFKVKNLPVLSPGEHSPARTDIIPKVMFSRKNGYFNTTETSFNDWESYGTWMYNAYLQDKSELSESTKQDLKEIIAGAESDFDKAKAIYEYVVNNTRYISIQLGEGGLEPFFAEDVHEKKYGDCKALSMYSLALMREAGLDAFYTIIEADTDHEANFEVDFANIYQGNHAIIGVGLGSDTIYADCTTSNIPFGKISSFTDGRYAVGINEDGGKLIKTNKYSDQENIKNIHTIISIDASQKMASIDVQCDVDGYDLTNRIIINKYSQKDIETKAYPYLYPYFSKEKFANIKMEYSDGKFKEQFSIATKKFVSSAGNYLILPLHIHKMGLTKIKKENRTTPIYFKNGSLHSYTTTIQIPEGYEWAGGIEKQIIESSFGNFEIREISTKENVVTIHIQVAINSGTFDSTLAKEFNQWVTDINKLEDQKFILRPLK